MDEADADEAVKAVVIICQGQTFFAGADISEFGTPKAFAQPMLPQVVDIIEGCTKPVVAAIHGTPSAAGSKWRSPRTTGWRCRRPSSACRK
jgi:3-hydroxyacyl-CoA dehydrogenase